jgi:hypothetical protein
VVNELHEGMSACRVDQGCMVARGGVSTALRDGQRLGLSTRVLALPKAASALVACPRRGARAAESDSLQKGRVHLSLIAWRRLYPPFSVLISGFVTGFLRYSSA